MIIKENPFKNILKDILTLVKKITYNFGGLLIKIIVTMFILDFFLGMLFILFPQDAATTIESYFYLKSAAFNIILSLLNIVSESAPAIGLAIAALIILYFTVKTAQLFLKWLKIKI